MDAQSRMTAVAALCQFDKVLEEIAAASRARGGRMTPVQKRLLDRELSRREALCAQLGIDAGTTFG